MGTQGGATTGEGDAADTGRIVNLTFGNSTAGTENMQSGATTALVTIQHSTANPSLSMVKNYSVLELV